MRCFTCDRNPFGSSAFSTSFAALSRAAAKSAGAKLRKFGALHTSTNWVARATVCERCPLRVVRAGVSYCGKPFLNQIHRDPIEGCGCPTHEKAKSPREHCPLNVLNRLAVRSAEGCNCKWCIAGRNARVERQASISQESVKQPLPRPTLER